MKNLMLVTILIFSISIVGISQVKEKFRDRENTSTIVVIKEDAAIDTELLDQHFELSQMSMSDQIMITTKPEEPTVPEASPLPEATPVTEAPAFEEASASIDDNVNIFFEQFEADKEKEEAETIAAEEEKSKTVVSNNVRSAPTRAKRNYPTKSSYDVKKAAQKKYYAKSKIKKQKKKNRRKSLFGKKKSNSCYSF